MRPAWNAWYVGINFVGRRLCAKSRLQLLDRAKALVAWTLALSAPLACAVASPLVGRAADESSTESARQTGELIARIEDWAGSGATVVEWSEVHEPGFRFFAIGRGQFSRLVALEGDRWPPLEGSAVLHAVVEHGARNPVQLARLALKLSADNGTLVTDAKRDMAGVPPAEAALAAAPKLDMQTLTYFYRSSRTRNLSRSRLDLATANVETETVTQLVAAVAGADAALEQARKELFSDSTALQMAAVDKLVSMAGDERVAAMLIDAVQHHASPIARGAAATGLGRVGTKAAVPGLSAVVRSDPDSTVRAASAEALGKIGVPAARAALQDASADADVDVREAAIRALKRLR